MNTVPDYRALLTFEEFAQIEDDQHEPLDPYYDALISDNVRFLEIDDNFPGGYEDPNFIPHATRGQQLLILLGCFDGQVKNGGITQFFWNFPEFIFEVLDALQEIADPILIEMYQKAVETLLGKRDQWVTLQMQWEQQGENPVWKTFQESYELLDLGWFDDDYFDEWGDKKDGEWTIEKRGLGYDLQRNLIAYIQKNPQQFIIVK